MISTILCILAAVVAIFFSGLLVRKQNSYQQSREELQEELRHDLGEAVDEFTALTGEPITEYSLEDLEKGMDALTKRLETVKIKPLHTERRRRYVKHSKNFTDD